MVSPTIKNSMEFPQKVKIKTELPYDPAILLLGVYQILKKILALPCLYGTIHNSQEVKPT